MTRRKKTPASTPVSSPAKQGGNPPPSASTSQLAATPAFPTPTRFAVEPPQHLGGLHSAPPTPLPIRLPTPTPPPPAKAVKAASPAPQAAAVLPSVASQLIHKTSDLFRLLFRGAGLVLVAFWQPILLGLLAFLVALPLLSIGWSAYRSLSSLTSMLISPLSVLHSANSVALLSPITALTCTTFHLFCPPGFSANEPDLKVGLVARRLREEAGRASDIFQSIVELSDLDAMGMLHQTEIWELAFTVKRGSNLADKDILANELVDLGDMTRDMKDKLISINSQGVNSFSWIVHEFTRLESQLLLLSPPPSDDPSLVASRTPESAAHLRPSLNSLISHLSTSLTALEQSIEQALPLAGRASSLGGRLQEEFFAEGLELAQELAKEPIWKGLLEGMKKELGVLKTSEDGLEKSGGFERRAVVKRDLKLVKESVSRLRDLRRGMEDLRTQLVGYRDNVGWFRAGVIGWFAGGHSQASLSHDPNDPGAVLALKDEEEIDVALEMEGLRMIVGRFAQAVDDAKSKGRRSGSSRIAAGDGAARLAVGGAGGA